MKNFLNTKYFLGAFTILALSHVNAFADMQESATKLAFGAMIGFFIGAIIVFYKLGEFICKKIYPNSPKWIKMVSGVTFTFIAFLIWTGITGK